MWSYQSSLLFGLVVGLGLFLRFLPALMKLVSLQCWYRHTFDLESVGLFCSGKSSGGVSFGALLVCLYSGHLQSKHGRSGCLWSSASFVSVGEAVLGASAVAPV